MTTIVNLFAGPGAGKSTSAAGVYSLLKLQGVSCELVTEYAKDVVWREALKILQDQIFVFAKQHHKMRNLLDKVDYIITDSPLILSMVYCDPIDTLFKELVFQRFSQMKNMNFYVRRVKPYIEVGRNQNAKEALLIDTKIKMLLEDKKIPYEVIKGDKEGINFITNKILDIEGKDVNTL